MALIVKMAIEALLIAISTLLFLFVRAKYNERSISKIYWKKNKRNSAILARCPTLKEGYQPTFWASNAHIQTMIGCISHFFSNRFDFRKEYLQMRDGGTISLEWYNPSTNSEAAKKISVTAKNIAGTNPIMLICGWIIGPDVERICIQAAEEGYLPVVYKSRGRDIPLTSDRLATYLDAADFSEAVDYVHAMCPFSDIFTIGYSQGCAPIIGYLGAKGKSSLITSAVLISTALDLESMLDTGLKSPYSLFIVEYFKSHIYNDQCMHSVIDIDDVKKETCLRKVLQHYHDSSQSCENFEEYLKINNPLSYAARIRTPTLFVNSLDDPVLDDQVPANVALKSNNYCMEVVTEKGGHCGFTTGFMADFWANDVALEFHRAALQCRGLLLSPIKNGFKRNRSETR